MACPTSTSATLAIFQQLSWELEVQGLLCMTYAILCTPDCDSNTETLAAGDQTANLWWRLQNGDVFTQHPPQVTIILIGINDLGAASCGTGASGIIVAVSGVVSRYLHCLIASGTLHDLGREQPNKQHACSFYHCMCTSICLSTAAILSKCFVLVTAKSSNW